MTVPDLGYRNGALARRILERIWREMDGQPPIRLMEVCGTHTVAVGKAGLRRAVPPNVVLLSGPGCPVCVTPASYIEAAARLALGGATVVTFGDMMRVPGEGTSLEEARARGGRVIVASSVSTALELARAERSDVVFLAVGFETTAPTVAAAVLTAQRENLGNFSVLLSHKLVPPALRLVLSDPACAVSGFILPGHVSTIIGTEPYRFLVDEFSVPGVVAGFELIDVLLAVEELVRMLKNGAPKVINRYTRVVRPEGNPRAWEAVAAAFEVADAEWRGIGHIPASGLVLRDTFARFDAARKYGLDLGGDELPAGCSCGGVLRGQIRPTACPIFGTACTPQTPVGPCMISAEGACGVSYRYGEA